MPTYIPVYHSASYAGAIKKGTPIQKETPLSELLDKACVVTFCFRFLGRCGIIDLILVA